VDIYNQTTSTVIDVTVPNSTSASIAKATPGLVSKNAEKRKRTDTQNKFYSRDAARAGLKFTPFVIESLGRFGPEARSWIGLLGDDAWLISRYLVKGYKPAAAKAMYVTHWHQVIGIALMKGNHRIIQHARGLELRQAAIERQTAALARYRSRVTHRAPHSTSGVRSRGP
jgi:hypothetical protein